MAIFGNLSDIRFSDVLTMLGQRSGVLTVSRTADDQRYDVHLSAGSLYSLVINGMEQRDVLRVRDSLVYLVNCRVGEFEFERRSNGELLRTIDLPVSQILQIAVTSIGEVEAYRTQFAAPQTRFIASGSTDPLVDQSLQAFWDRSEGLLRVGTHAEEVAQSLEMPLDQVQLSLYKLRLANRIRPIRAFAADPEHGGSSASSSSGGRNGPFALSMPGGGGRQQSQERPNLVSSPPTQEKRGLVARMLQALSWVRR